MNLRQLLPLIEETEGYRKLVDDLGAIRDSLSVAVLDAARAYFISGIYSTLNRPILVVTGQPEKAKNLYDQLSGWCPSPRIKFLPEPDALPYQRIATDSAAETERVQALFTLANNEDTTGHPLIVTSAPALMHKTTLFSEFMSTVHTIKEGDSIDPYKLLSRWESMGYRPESTVETPGTISHRGGIIDIYPAISDLPVRVEFFGNTIDSIRIFDPLTQRSQSVVPSITVTPATELLSPFLQNETGLKEIINRLNLSNCNPETTRQWQQDLAQLLNGQRPTNLPYYAPLFNHDTVLSYLPRDGLLILDEPASLRNAVEDLEREAEELHLEKLNSGDLPDNFPHPYFTWEEIASSIKSKQFLRLISWGTEDESPHHLDFSTPPSHAGQLPSFVEKTKQLLKERKRIIVISQQASRLSELFEAEDVFAPPLTEIQQLPPPGSLTLFQGSQNAGWILDNTTHLYTDAEIFGFVKQRRLTRKHPVPHQKFLVDMNPGDYVVHVEHGIAKFAGVTTMTTNSTRREYLVLQYAAGDKLYVPADQLDRVSRYIGAGERPPSLSRLGTQEWTRAKQRVEESVAEIARGLLALYASREVVPGFAFSRDTVWQQELEAAFPYVETPDQIQVQQQVKEDMEKARPMDRLVCGDVGYGKTEVAIRAAFKAVMDNKQVAVLVPTTVLAEQHFYTFSQRLSAFPVRVEVLSRFRTPKEQEAIINDLAEGRVDICIGTHRLLQKDVEFKDPGLLIIDEEQRFGVNHKEHLKKLRQEMDVLTLSATPIPRTLHMSLVNVRDMSTMETPPEERLPIKTFVAEYNDRIVREAILREMERNGQVFFVHNRVQSISFIAGRLQELVPEARVAVAHGQMPEAGLEKVMADFARDETDVLVCTTIIESGLDMPRVNTLIVNRADKFGLTQLYQLRGRVGRGTELAYAYFLFDREKRLTPTAERRLRTIFEATELGAGFNIAMKDLEIRGAGTLLGTRQSGHISTVGFNLYCELLGQAVEEQKALRAGVKKAEITRRLPEPAIDLPLRAYIPEDYVADLHTRLVLYQNLTTVKETEQIEAVRQELRDRFGTPPNEVENLLYALRIKVLAAKAGIESVSTEQGQIIIRKFEGTRFDKEKLQPLVRDGVKIGATQVQINPKQLRGEWRGVVEGIVERMV